MPTAIWCLEWRDVDPAKHPFDPNAAAARLVDCAAALGVGKRCWSDDDRYALEAAFDRALVREVGAWAAGWRWSASEPGSGGPVQSYCCESHSLLRAGDQSPRESADRALAALVEWRAILEELAARFDVMRREHTGLSIAESAERAAALLLPWTLERTRAEDAWYRTFAQLLSWYLERRGSPADRVSGHVLGVIHGRFQSWTAPDPETANGVIADLARVIPRVPSSQVDALGAWVETREVAFTAVDLGPPDTCVEDGHRAFIERSDRARDVERADRMLRALADCRRSAERDEALTFERLAAWHSIATGGPSEFRTTDAFAKGGRERYAYDENTKARFERALADAHRAEDAAWTRAARVYLDVCFFHPFADGNARAARLALDHVLTRAGYRFHAAEPLFVVSRSAFDRNGAWHFHWLVHYLSGPAAARG